MKRTKFFKLLSLFVVMSAFILAGCSSKDDEPNNPDDNGSGSESISTIPYKDLWGTWQIESIKDSESGKVVNINHVVTIGMFEPQQSSDDAGSFIAYNIETWAHSYDNLVSYSVNDKEDSSFATISFVKDKNKALNTSEVFSIIFSIGSKELVETFVLSDLTASNKSIVAKTSAYGYTYDGNVTMYSGAITMKKL